MLGYVRDKWTTARLRAKYQRIVQERVLELVAESGPRPVADDQGNWLLLGDGKSPLSESERMDSRAKARRLVVDNPHARNILRLLEIYVVGPGLKLTQVECGQSGDSEIVQRADGLWRAFFTANRCHFSYREYARRAWRDGECFLRCFAQPEWPPVVRFVDPETIGATREWPDSQGILTEPDDVETPRTYLRIDPASGELAEEISAGEILHTKVGVDSNQKRGVTVFAPMLAALSSFDRWLEIELMARKLQASIVLWRKVQGSPSQAASLADSLRGQTNLEAIDGVRREKYRPGTILTTSQGTELQYLQPNTNFGDAVPLGRMVLLCAAAGAGLPEFMLTSDASNANFASTMVAEGPAVKMFESEQQFFAGEFDRLWRWVMSEAIEQGLLPRDFLERVRTEWKFPQLVSRDRPREREADARLVKAQVLSRAEVARRDGADPDVMRREIEGEVRAEE